MRYYSFTLVFCGLIGAASLLMLDAPLRLSLQAVLAFFYLCIYPFISLHLTQQSVKSPLRIITLLVNCTSAAAAHLVLQNWLAYALLSLFTLQVLYDLRKTVVARLQRRFLFVLRECWVDLVFLMMIGHLFWSFASISARPFLGFQEPYKSLTAIHFAYAGMALPLCFARFIQMFDPIPLRAIKTYSLSLASYFLGFFLVALGIYQLTALEILGAGLLATSLISIGIHICIFLPMKGSRKLTAGGIFALFLWSGFAMLSYAGRNFIDQPFTIEHMIRFHGIINSLIIVPLLLTWSFSFKKQGNFPYLKPPFSRILGKNKIDGKFIKSILVANREQSKTGLTDLFASFGSSEFDAKRVDSEIQLFYEHIESFQMDVRMRWHFPFTFSSWLYAKISSGVQQFNFPNGDTPDIPLQSEIRKVDSDQDGRDNVRAWIRKYCKSNELIYLALYSQHGDQNRIYMNIAFPWFHSQLTSILRLENHGVSDVRLTTRNHEKNPGFEGIFLLTSLCWFRIPMNETIDVWTEKDLLRGLHRVWFFGLPLLTLDYSMKKLK